MKKKLCCILAGTMLMSTLTLGGAAVSANNETETKVSNTSPHWGESYISRAKAEGILAGIGAEEREPDAAVTRAEFVKMTLVAMRLYPGCVTAERLADNVRNTLETPADMTDHPLTEDGYTEIALNFGLLSSENCPDGLFHPNDLITRYDASKITSRMAGLVYAANNGDSAIPFTDAISESNIGTVSALAEEKILLGYEDNTMRGDSNISLAEACAILDRCIDYTEQGIDESIKIIVNGENLTDSTPVQIIDGIVYVPYSPVIISANETEKEPCHRIYYRWRPEDQYYSVTNGNDLYSFNAGSSNSITDERLHYEWPIFNKCRLMRGEFMIPVYNIYTEKSGVVPNITASYNKDENQIRISAPVFSDAMWS